MLRSEADTLLNMELDDKEWALLDMVYTFHPSIEDKQQLKALFVIGGWVLIEDLKPRAEKIAQLKEREYSAKVEMRRIKDDIKAASNSRFLYPSELEGGDLNG